MSSLIRHVCLLLVGVTLLLSAATPAWASEDVYRCRVLGDRIACDRLPASTDGTAVMQTVPGPYARYLIHNGRPFEQAIAEARAIGEEPMLQLTRRHVQRTLSGIEAYEQYVRGGPAPDARRDGDLARASPLVAR
jgi:hypothetical protein